MERPETSHDDAAEPRGWRRLLSGVKGVVAIAGALVTLAAAATLLMSTAEDLTETAPIGEAERLGKLQAGITFERFRSMLGSRPDIQRTIGDAPDSNFLARRRAKRYIFIRPQVYVQVVVADGTVLGFAVVARTGTIRPRYRWPTGSVITLQSSTFASGPKVIPVSVGGFCGANRAQYFEAYGGSNADNAQQFALGVSSMGFNGDRAFEAICAAGSSLNRCDVSSSYVNVLFEPDGAECFLGSTGSAALRRHRINTYVVTAPTVPLFSELLEPTEAQSIAGNP